MKELMLPSESETACSDVILSTRHLRVAVLHQGLLRAIGPVSSLLAPGETSLEQAFLRIIGGDSSPSSL